MEQRIQIQKSKKIISEWITDVNAKHKTINSLDGKVGDNLDELGYGDYFLGTTNGVIHERTGKLDFIKLLCERQSQENEKTRHRLGEDIFKACLKKDYYSKYRKNPKFNNKKISSPMKKLDQRPLIASPYLIYISVVLSIFTLLCNSYHHPSPEFFTFLD